MTDSRPNTQDACDISRFRMSTIAPDRTLQASEATEITVRAVIVEHDEFSRRLIRSMLAAIGGVEIVAEASNAPDARLKIEGTRPDLAFVEVDIPGGNGIELLRTLEKPPEVIFMTARPEFAVPAFEVQPIDFLLKPVKYQRFLDSVRRGVRRIAERRVAALALRIAASAAMIHAGPATGERARIYPDQLAIRVRRRRFWLNVGDIAWIEGASQYCRVHAKGDEFLLSRSLSSLECELDPERFFRVHRSAIVNATHVREIRSAGDGRYNVYLHGGQVLPVGRSRRGVLDEMCARIGRSR
jgi:two-component system, LytTR family, response regulator